MYGGPSEAGKFRDQTLFLTRQDIKDIVKVTSTEVVLGLSDRNFRNQVAGVVDTILNRTASGAWGRKGDVRSVINSRSQFSKISGLATAYGSVQAMPDRMINRRVEAAVLDYLQYRLNGGESIIGSHLNYANPYHSSPQSQSWVQPLALRARREGLVFGAGDAIHVHGTNPENQRKRPSYFRIGLIK